MKTITNITNALRSDMAVNTMIGLVYAFVFVMTLAILHTVCSTMVSAFTAVESAIYLIDTLMKALFLSACSICSIYLMIMFIQAGPTICAEAQIMSERHRKPEKTCASSTDQATNHKTTHKSSVPDMVSLRSDFKKHLAGLAEKKADKTAADGSENETSSSKDHDSSCTLADGSDFESVEPPPL